MATKTTFLVWSSSLICLLLMLQMRTGRTAPTNTQHLAISVEGNTPTLIVTSAEISATPKILHATTTASSIDARTVDNTTKMVHKEPTKHVAVKSKNKSTKLHYGKKQRPTVTKEKLERREKSSMATATMQTPITTPPPTTTARQVVTTLLAPTGSSLPQTTSVVIDATVANNQYETVIIAQHNTTVTNMLQTTNEPVASSLVTTTGKPKSSTAQQEDERVSVTQTITTTAANVGSVPPKTQKIAMPPDTLAPNVTLTTQRGSTTESQILRQQTTVAVSDSGDRQNYVKTLPTDILASSTATTTLSIITSTSDISSSSNTETETETTTTPATVAKTTSTSKTPVITTEANDENDKKEKANDTTTTLTAHIKRNHGNGAAVDYAAAFAELKQQQQLQQGTVTSDEFVLSAEANASESIITNSSTAALNYESQENSDSTTQQPVLPTKAANGLLTAATAATTETTTITTTSIPGTNIFIDAARKDEHEAHEGIVKLIDLEKHDDDAKSIAELQRQQQQQTQQQQQPHDNGHDGVKKTKKKQLIDKHFLVDTISDSSPTSSITARITTAEHISSLDSNSEFKTTTLNDKIDISSTIEKSTALPTLMPVHNGYLGPIFMEERTFTVIHASKPNPKVQHEPSIEAQLRDGRIVEIIAPTALLEQTTSAAAAPAEIKANRRSEKAAGASINTITNQPSTSSTALPPPPVDRVEYMQQNVPVLSTTVFQVPELLTSTTRLPANRKFGKASAVAFEKATLMINSEQTESKISDIQIEVYDSTVDSIVASTNFKDTEAGGGYHSPPSLESAVGTTKPPVAATQERFTQYVVDRTDSSTQESSVASLSMVAAGKPEPAAIEIHINVSEGFGNESEDLEFSYRQSDYTGNSRPNVLNTFSSSKSTKPLSLKPFAGGSIVRSNDSNERSDEILVVEIIDTGDNSTENSVSSENINPIFTFRSDTDADVELKDIKYFPQEAIIKPPQSVSDELFLADLKKGIAGGSISSVPQPPLPPPPPPRKPIIDRDSDTIFYISNTEVKVGESLPTTNSYYEQQQLRKTRLENQFFPVNYMASTHPNSNAAAPKSEGPMQTSQSQQHRYEEDIILSPIRNTADSLKIFRSAVGADGAPPLDVTYVGESVMEVEQQASGAGLTTTTTYAASLPSSATQTPDVIIQPAILPEMSIGVPVIGELPPQIELKEIDFMPDEANQLRSGVYENNIDEENALGNVVNANAGGGMDAVDKLVESSIQYGGDLIDEVAAAGGDVAGFDGIEGSYPFGNPAVMRGKAKHVADYAHFTLNHGVSNLRKDELSVNVANSGEAVVGGGVAELQGAVRNTANLTQKELLLLNKGNDVIAIVNELSMNSSSNSTYAMAERMSNATAFSVMEDPSGITADGGFGFKNLYTLIIGVFIVVLPVVVTVSMACGLRYLYHKYQASSANNNDNNTDAANGGVAGGQGDGAQDESYNTQLPLQSPISQLPPPPTTTTSSSPPTSTTTTKTSELYKEITTMNKDLSSSINIDDDKISTSKHQQQQQQQPSKCCCSHALDIVNEKCHCYRGSKSCSSSSSNNINTNETETTTAPHYNNPELMSSDYVNENDNNNKFSKIQSVHMNNIANYMGPNGSVTKMTLKNNHLIVETEERNDISRDARETKMHYNTSEKDGVFVVEVARGIDSKSIPESPSADVSVEQRLPCFAATNAGTVFKTEDEKTFKNHEEVQIHQPPPEILPNSNTADELQRSLHQIEEVEEPALSPNANAGRTPDQTNVMRSSNTGLSQSDLSSTSSTDSNKRYSYGNQELYSIEQPGYATISLTTNLQPIATTTDGGDEAQDDDHKSENGHSFEHTPQPHPNGAGGGDDAQNKVNCSKLSKANNEEQELSSNKSNKCQLNGYVVQADNNEIEIEIQPLQGSAEVEVAAAVELKIPIPMKKIPVVDVANEIITDTAAVTENKSSTFVEPTVNGLLNGVLDTKDDMNGDCSIIVNGINETIDIVAATVVESANDNAYDSIMSLPDPPSTEEITQLSDYILMETNQLDSLPPPPPPPLFLSATDFNVGENVALQIKQQLQQQEITTATALINNGINGHNNIDEEILITNGHEPEHEISCNNNNNSSSPIRFIAALPTPPHHDHSSSMMEHIQCNSNDNKMLPAPLTPPASPSPPPSPPAHFSSNGVLVNSVSAGVVGSSSINGGGICAASLPVAVDVNGS